MRLLMIGAPGAGKGTQAARIADHFGLVHISSGDLLRSHVKRGTAIGRAARSYLDRGDLVPDAVVLDMLRKPVVEAAAADGYVLDGFPRTVGQAEQAYDVAAQLGISVQLALHLQVARAELVARLVARGVSTGRTDDTPEVVEHRLDLYEEQTRPILEYYAQRERLLEVNGDRPVDEVTWSAIVQLQRAQRALNADGGKQAGQPRS